MEVSESLFSNYAPNPCGKLLFTCQANRQDEGDVTIALYERCLVESSTRSKTYLLFDFDVKFAFTTSPPFVSFEKSEQSVCYALRSVGDLQQWREILKAKINQRGFHEQFKPKKKIGKGNFASVYLAEKLEDGKNYAVKAFSKEAAYSEDKGKECLIKEI
jgi:serine/threonine protein kinase